MVEREIDKRSQDVYYARETKTLRREFLAELATLQSRLRDHIRALAAMAHVENLKAL